MKLVDEAAGLAAITYARRRVVTVSIDRMDFLVPISVGELVTFRASVRTPVPSPLAVSAEEQRRLSQAALRRSNRLTERRQMLAHQPDLGS